MKCIFPVKKHRVVKGNRILYQHKCGRCMPCRITRKQELTLRCMLESKLHDFNTFVTLTFNDQNRPSDHNVSKTFIQKVIKKIRRYSGRKFRYLIVGEYGERSGREHYHMLLFGYPHIEDMPILKAWRGKNKETGKKEPLGFIQIAPLTNGGAGYAAGYTTKKLTKNSKDLKEGQEPEFCLMSRGRRPDGGLGYRYIDNIIESMERDKMNFVGKDYRYIRVNGMLLPVDQYLRDQIDKKLGTNKQKSLAEELTISLRSYHDMSYPEAENDKIAKSEIRARQKLARQRRYRKL